MKAWTIFSRGTYRELFVCFVMPLKYRTCFHVVVNSISFLQLNQIFWICLSCALKSVLLCFLCLWVISQVITEQQYWIVCVYSNKHCSKRVLSKAWAHGQNHCCSVINIWWWILMHERIRLTLLWRGYVYSVTVGVCTRSCLCMSSEKRATIRIPNKAWQWHLDAFWPILVPWLLLLPLCFCFFLFS